jgi:hypothetical protein
MIKTAKDFPKMLSRLISTKNRLLSPRKDKPYISNKVPLKASNLNKIFKFNYSKKRKINK